MIGDPRTTRERNRLPGWRENLVRRVQIPVEAERLQIITGADVPAAANSEVSTQMRFLVLRIALPEKVRVLPLIVEREVTR